MLSNEETNKVLQMLFATYEALGQTVTPAAANLMVDDLSEFTFDQIMKSLTLCRREVGGRFNLKEILTRLDAQAGWIGANEAWSIACSLQDERVSGAATRQITAALDCCAGCSDDISARMSFIEAYNRICAEDKAMGVKPVWFVSLGFDKSTRVPAIEAAKIAGRISQSQADNLLVDLREPDANVFKLLEGAKRASKTSVSARKALDDMKSLFGGQKSKPVEKKDLDAELRKVKENFKDSEEKRRDRARDAAS